MSDLKKSLVIETVSATQDRDNIGETLIMDGADTSQLKDGFVNEDHAKGFDHLLGRMIDAKKIYSEGQCETPYQFKQWGKLKRPFLWTKFELFDGFGHAKADAVAAICRYYMDRGIDPPIKTSVEGKVIERNGKALTRTLVKGIALTVVPCNPHTSTEVVDVMKSMHIGQYYIDALTKSEAPLVPIFSETQESPIERIHRLANLALFLVRKANSK